MQVLNFRKLLIDQKFVFLIGDEIAQYPIDFKERFGIDYSAFPLKPIGIREINRLIWHIQLSYHNGGDFFNEVIDGHPNLISSSSIMNDSMEETMEDLRDTLNSARSTKEIVEVFSNGEWDNLDMIQELYLMRNRTDKDILVMLFCCCKRFMRCIDPAARIAPAIFYQPHFSYIHTDVRGDNKGRAIMITEQYDKIQKSPIFKNFKYIKTFAPMRRITTSYGGAVRFMYNHSGKTEEGSVRVVTNEVVERTLFRGYLVDEQERLFKDCILVRFEDGKLNPKATFTALAAFLDIPYTETLTYCSFYGHQMDVIDPQNVQGFDPASVYKTYDEYANDAERCYLEYFLRDAYKYYGYDFKYYDGGPMDMERVEQLVDGFDTLNYYLSITTRFFYEDQLLQKRQKALEAGEEAESEKEIAEHVEKLLEEFLEHQKERDLNVAKVLLKGLQFVTKDGRPLKFMPKLELDPALLEQPLYH